eukprot:scaffold290218_cov36-Tisochrysis_lutea.AAC.1
MLRPSGRGYELPIQGRTRGEKIKKFCLFLPTSYGSTSLVLHSQSHSHSHSFSTNYRTRMIVDE